MKKKNIVLAVCSVVAIIGFGIGYRSINADTKPASNEKQPVTTELEGGFLQGGIAGTDSNADNLTKDEKEAIEQEVIPSEEPTKDSTESITIEYPKEDGTMDSFETEVPAGKELSKEELQELIDEYTGTDSTEE